MSSRAAYTPPSPANLTSRPPRRSGIVAQGTTSPGPIPKAPRLPREAKTQGKSQAKVVAPRKPALKLVAGAAVADSGRTIEMVAPEVGARRAHARELARQKDQQQRKTPARKSAQRTRPSVPLVPPAVPSRPTRSRRTAPPPVPEAARRKSRPKTVNKTVNNAARSTPPAPPARVVPTGPRKRVAAVMPPKPRQTLASVAPPPPRQSLASFAPPPPRQSLASVAADTPVAPSKPATVVHIASREPTQQFPFSAPSAKRGRKRRDDTVPYALGQSEDRGSREARVIPLVRVAPDDIAMPLVSEEPTDELLQSAPGPFIADDPNEDLLSPYRPSLFRSITRTVKNFLD